MNSPPSSIQSEMSSNKLFQFPNGSSIELFGLKSAAVFLMDYNDEQTLRFLRLGDFSVILTMQKSSPIMTITCTVDELQWPITKDAPVIRVGTRGFAFALPGLLYGLQFASSCTEEVMDYLETIFMKFSHYKDLKNGEAGYPWEDDEPYLWAKSRTKIEKISKKILSRFGHVPGKSPSAVGSEDSGLKKVLRTSAVTKMVSNAILSGSLKSKHIDIHDMRPQDKYDHENVSNVMYLQAFPSISVFINLVEAVEIAWVIASGNSHLLKEKKHGELRMLVGFQIWRLNQEGIAAFLEKLVGQ